MQSWEGKRKMEKSTYLIAGIIPVVYSHGYAMSVERKCRAPPVALLMCDETPDERVAVCGILLWVLPQSSSAFPCDVSGTILRRWVFRSWNHF
nr:hypothetical protein CFP56_32454 [Quercus suber]